MKERFLTILVPIKDDVTTPVETLPVASPDNINVIYKHEGVYKRVWFNPGTSQYEYHEVVDREFPYLGRPLEIFDFTYDATRMGTAPTISAQGVMWFADKDENGNDVTLEGLWSQEVHVSFNGENYYLKQIPTSSKSNEDARYKYDIDFVSERVVLETLYIYDVVQPFITERPISESSVFSFYGDISELAKRINASLLRSGLATLQLQDGVSESDILTYEEWNQIGLGTYDGDKPIRKYIGSQGTSPYRYFYPYYGGNYSAYLRGEIYATVNGEFVMHGYQCIIGKDKKGELSTSEEKLITFDKNTIHEALQEFHDTFGLQYYITRELDDAGTYTGNTLIMVADCEHDFADLNEQGTDYVRDEDNIPTTEHPFNYGVEDALLSKEKTNTTDKIVTRITGVGSEENIPWYYPNPTADGWIKPVYKTNGEVQDIEVEYQSDEGETVADNVLYEKYLKNRIGDVLQWGRRVNYIDARFSAQYYVYDDMLGHRYNFKYAFKVTDTTNILHFKAICGRYDSSSSIIIRKDGQPYSNPQIPSLFTECVAEIPTGSYEILFHIQINSTILKTTADYYHHQENVTYTHGGTTETIVVECFSKIKTMYLYLGGSSNKADWFWYSDFTDPMGSRESVVQPARGKTYYAWHNNDETSGSVDKYEYDSDGIRTVSLNCYVDVQEFVQRFMTGFISTVRTDGWSKKGATKKVELEDLGMELPIGLTPTIFDTIEFQRLKYITPQSTLMPEVYIKTDGERRFYNAVNYPLSGGTPDPMIGEVESDGQIVNPIYYKEGSDTHYDFENEYMANMPKEHIESFDDIKPTIEGQTNYIHVATRPDDWVVSYRNYYRQTANGEYVRNTSPVWSETSIFILGRIDVIEEFAYDETDNDEIWENNENGNIGGEYKHPYFFAKLRPLGFNIFDLALQDDMVISMTTGHCGACNFKIGVDENTKKNPVQIWEYDVYEGGDFDTKVFKYAAGELRRYVDTSNLYYDTNGEASGYILVDTPSSNRVGFIVDGDESARSRDGLFARQVYESAKVINGEVGALKQEGKTHFEGDVKTDGRFIESQQDTSENYVWVALMKDTDTYGTIMPSARPDYADHTYDVFIRPQSISDVHIETNQEQEIVASTNADDEEKADKFIIINIRMPQVYLRRAERELSRKIVEYMYDNNYQKFNFSIKFSRVFLAQNLEVEGYLNENSVLYVSFNNKTYRQYVKHYTYRMSNGEVLPEINVDMNEQLSVSHTAIERQTALAAQVSSQGTRFISRRLNTMQQRIERRSVDRGSDTVVIGSIISRDSASSISEVSTMSNDNSYKIYDESVERTVLHDNVADFVDTVNEFNSGVDDRLKQIRGTVETRLLPLVPSDASKSCSDFVIPEYGLENNKYFWLNADKQEVEVPQDCPAVATNGMTDIDWVNYNF